MPAQILVFDPLNPKEVSKAENDLSKLLDEGWEIVGSVGGNRATPASPDFKDYVVLILRKQSEKERNEAIFRKNNPLAH